MLESNHIFDKPKGTLRNKGRGLRVRSCEVLDGNGPGSTMTFKGPRQPGGLKKRVEEETTVEDPAAARVILKHLGFKEIAFFQKRRETWRLGDCTIELDEVPHLGCFVEIEGPGESEIETRRTELCLDQTDVVSSSYIKLLVEHCERHQLSAKSISF